MCASCVNKNNTPTPENEATKAVAPYSKIDGYRTFDGMSTTSIVYSSGSMPNSFDTVWLNNIKINFKLLTDTTLAIVCKDSLLPIDDIFPLKNTEVNNDTFYSFSKMISLHSGATISYFVNTNRVTYTYGGSAGGVSVYNTYNTSLKER